MEFISLECIVNWYWISIYGISLIWVQWNYIFIKYKNIYAMIIIKIKWKKYQYPFFQKTTLLEIKNNCLWVLCFGFFLSRCHYKSAWDSSTRAKAEIHLSVCWLRVISPISSPLGSTLTLDIGCSSVTVYSWLYGSEL